MLSAATPPMRRCTRVKRVAASLLVVALGATPTRADEPCPNECHIAKARGLLANKDPAGARTELLAAYQQDPQPELLFALGQVELELGNDKAAIGYYERFIASDPGEDQIALAQQAIGAARMRLAQPKPKVVPPAKPPIRRERRWHLENTGLVVLGGAALAVGGGLLADAISQAGDRSGSLKDYDDRLDQARTLRLTAAGIGTLGALAIGFAIVRWRLDRTEIRAAPVTGGAAVVVGRRW